MALTLRQSNGCLKPRLFLIVLSMVLLSLCLDASQANTVGSLQQGLAEAPHEISLAKTRGSYRLSAVSSSTNASLLTERALSSANERWKKKFGCDRPAFDEARFGFSPQQIRTHLHSANFSANSCTQKTVCDYADLENTEQMQETVKLCSAYHQLLTTCNTEALPQWILDFYKQQYKKDPRDLPQSIEADDTFILRTKDQWLTSGGSEFLSHWYNISLQQPDHPHNGGVNGTAPSSSNWAEYMLEKLTCGLYDMDCWAETG